ncbi:MAG: hypothetical protein LBL51_05750 [Synergistaceae bacterium]|jgi:hypothetical protein|nr:hypothetical protein [Synergistaceae bacterium]
MKKRLAVLLAALFAALMTRYVFVDINLDVDLLRETLGKVPGMVLENLEFEREISGDLWRVRIPVAERRDGVTEVRSLDALRRMENGREWSLRSAWGVYSERAESADLTALRGTLEMDSRVLNLESPYLSWTKGKGDFVFPRGVVVYDAEFLLRAETASIDASGVIVLDKGGVIEWKSGDRGN